MKFVMTLLVCLATWSGAAHAATVRVVPATPTVQAGSELAVRVEVSDLAGPEQLAVGAFDFDLLFDPALLSVASIDFGMHLDPLSLGSVGEATEGPGKIGLLEVSLDDALVLAGAQPDRFDLAIVTFRAVVPGTAHLDLDVHVLGDAFGMPIAVAASGSAVSVVTSPVPEPAGWMAFGKGALVVAALAGRRSRRRHAGRAEVAAA